MFTIMYAMTVYICNEPVSFIDWFALSCIVALDTAVLLIVAMFVLSV